MAAPTSSRLNHVLLEWCGSDSSFFGMPSVDSKGCTVTRLTMREDVTTDHGFGYAQSAANNAPKDSMIFLWPAIACTGVSPWQNLNKNLPGGMGRIQEHWNVFRNRWKKRVSFVDWLSQAGRRWRTCIERPKGCYYWRWKTVRSFLHTDNLQEVCFGGCAIGEKGTFRELPNKPWCVCTSDSNILTALKPLQCSNVGNPSTGHFRAECKGVDCKESGIWISSFNRKVHKAFARTACG